MQGGICVTEANVRLQQSLLPEVRKLFCWGKKAGWAHSWVLNPKCDFKGKKKIAFELIREKRVFLTAWPLIPIFCLHPVFVLLLKRHKTTIYSPKLLEAVMRGAKEERGFIPISSPLRKFLWKMMIFFHVIPHTLLGLVSEMPRKVFRTSPATRNPAVYFWGSTLFSKQFVTRCVSLSGLTELLCHGRYDTQEIFIKKLNLFWKVSVLEIICLHRLYWELCVTDGVLRCSGLCFFNKY